jgi:hypothetical protein
MNETNLERIIDEVTSRKLVGSVALAIEMDLTSTVLPLPVLWVFNISGSFPALWHTSWTLLAACYGEKADSFRLLIFVVNRC